MRSSALSGGTLQILPLLGALIGTALLGPPGQAAPGPQTETGSEAGASVVDYRIEARLEADSKRLDGRETIVWRNTTWDTVNELWFHLYWNAFANDRSSHLWEARGKLRGQRVRDGWGWQRVTKLSAGGNDLSAQMTWQQPDDGRPEDRTVFSVPLPQGVGPGESVEIEIEWESQVPRVRRRTGHADDFLFIAQWFPKLGVYEEGRGWNCHQFHARTEFYADYGTYDVTLDLPLEYSGKIGASGVTLGQGTVDETTGRVVTRFLAPSREDQARVDATGHRALVHDFTWTADPDYLVEKDTFYFDEWAREYADEVARVTQALGREPGELRQRDVRITLLLQPEHEAQRDRHIDATCAALFFYGLWFGEYPYEHITVVDPAWGGGAAGGMEYATLFTCGTRMFTSPEMHRPEGVTIHEAGHQFWYGLVGNNEFEAAWMDEGFNSFADSETAYRRYGERRSDTRYSGLPKWGVAPARRPGGGRLANILIGRGWNLGQLWGLAPGGRDLRLDPLGESGFVDWWRDQPFLTFVESLSDPRWHDRSRYLSDPDSDPVDRNGWEYVDSRSYRTNSYPRPAVILRSLPALVGDEAFLRGMRHYSESWRYRHPYPDDFIAAFTEGSGQDVSWYFEDMLRTTKTVDWSLDVSDSRLREPVGFLEQEDGQLVLHESPRSAEDLAEGSKEQDTDEEQQESEPDALWRHEVLVRRSGGLRLPVTIEVRFEGAESQQHVWTREMQAESTWWRLPIEASSARIQAVIIDPERRWWVDRNMSDNQWFRSGGGEGRLLAPLRWAERVATQYGHFLHGYAAVGG